MTSSDNPFGELPGTLVDDLLSQADGIGEQYIAQIEAVRCQREEIRERMAAKRLLAKHGDLPLVEEPTTCGIDGARVTERLLATDIVAVAAIAVEGMTPPSERHHWEKPHCETLLTMESHHANTNRIASGLMIAMELKQAVNAPHGVKFIDNSLATPVIQLNQAVAASADAPNLEISQRLQERLHDALTGYRHILSNRRSDQAFVGVPKYTSNDEIGALIDVKESKDDRNLMTLVLESGEYTTPQPLKAPQSNWHVNTERVTHSYANELQSLADESCEYLSGVHILYYRPSHQMPALRLETTAGTAKNRHQLSTLLTAVRGQCLSATTMEPFPLFIADRMVKSLSPAMAAVIGITATRSGLQYSGPTSDIYHGLRSYRT